jgi:tetratricopeptide (TPR) repeat protein
VARDSFKTLADKLGRTSYGRLAPLYAGHAALRGDHPGEAVTFYRQFIAAGPETDPLKQIALLNLARALEATGDAAGARKELEAAVAVSGPVASEADFELAAATQAAGERDKALELYQKFLGDHPDAPDRELARARVIELGGTPPAEPSPLGGANPLQIMQMNDAAQ